MKKIVLVAIAGIFGFTQARAQITLAPEAGINLAKMEVDPSPGSPKNRVGFKGGLMVRIPITSGLYIEPGAMYSMKGYKLNSSVSIGGQNAEVDTRIGVSAIEIRVNLGYEFNLGNAGGLFVTAGPYVGFNVGGKVVTETTLNGIIDANSTVDRKIEFGSDNDDDMKSTDFGLNFGLGYRLPMGLYVRGQYGLGLTNLSNVNDGTLKNRVMSFTLGYAFPVN